MSPREYEEEGCVGIPSFLDGSELEKLRSICASVLEQWRGYVGEGEKQHGLINMSGLTDRSYFPKREPWFYLWNLICSQKIHDLVSSVIPQDLFFLNSQLFFTPKKSKAGYWHRDSQYLGLSEEKEKEEIQENRIIHLHLPLYDDPLFQFVPGSHNRWDSVLENEVRFEKKGRKQSDPLPCAKSYRARAGDAILFSAHGIHRGKEYHSDFPRLTLDLLYGQWNKSFTELVQSLQKVYPSKKELKLIEGNSSILRYTRSN